MSPTRTPRSAARARSITTRNSGLPLISVESTSTTSGMVFIFSEQLVRVLDQLLQIRTTNHVLNVGVAETAAGDRRHLLHARSQLTGILLQILAENVDTRSHHQVAVANLALFDRRQLHVNRGDVYQFLLATADRRQRVSHAGKPSHICRHAFGQSGGRRERKPSGARTLISNCDWSSTGRKFLPTNMKSGTMLTITSKQASHDHPTMPIDHVSILVYVRSIGR